MTVLNFRTLGEGPLLVLLHGAAEDADMLEPQAKAFAASGRRVAWYDRRGTGSTPRAGWPAGGVAQHADDAAAIITALGGAAQVLGFSSGGVVALALAAAHPELELDVIAWEPAAIAALDGGIALHEQIMAPVEAHLTVNPDDWTGAYAVALDMMSGGRADLASAAVAAQMVNAEAAIRDDARIITRHEFAPGTIPADRVRLAHGGTVADPHGAVVSELVAAHGLSVVVVQDADDHEVYLNAPEVLASVDWSR
ncbi:MAG: alpha/beta fold hydrolase [Nakamurella sp.]